MSTCSVNERMLRIGLVMLLVVFSGFSVLLVSRTGSSLSYSALQLSPLVVRKVRHGLRVRLRRSWTVQG